MLPMANPLGSQYQVTTENDLTDGWVVMVGTDRYVFGTDADAAQTFAAAATHTPGLVTWIAGARALNQQFALMLAEAQRLSDLYDDNELFPLLQAIMAMPGVKVPGTTLTLERIIALGALFQDLKTFLAAPTVGDPPAGLTLPIRRQVITFVD